MLEQITEAPGGSGLQLAQIHDVASGWYQAWYFELRLEEEIYRAKRYALPLTVAVFRLNQEWDPDREACISVLNRAISRLRRSDLPGITLTAELAICLPHASVVQADAVIRRLLPLFEGYDPTVGVAGLNAGFPTQSILARARRAACSDEAQLGHKPPTT